MPLNRGNVDRAELAKFAGSVSLWWDEQGVFKALHDINPLRLRYICAHTRLANRRVLDAGCGGGILSEAMAAQGAHVTGIDMGVEPLAVARLHLRESALAVDYRLSTVEELAAEHPAGYDVVTCMELLEHVPDACSVVAACARLVRPGGKVFFATINRNLKAFIFAILGAEYLLGLVPRGTHTYGRFVKPSEIAGWGAPVGLKVLNITGLNYNPFTRSYRLGGSVRVNYLTCLQRQKREDPRSREKRNGLWG